MKSTRERYLEHLVERRESAKACTGRRADCSDVTFRVIEPPIVPSRPWPKRLLLLSVFLLVVVTWGVFSSLYATAHIYQSWTAW